MTAAERLIVNLEELKKEKACLEKTLDELHQTRTKLDAKSHTVDLKYATLERKHNEMQEMLKIAQSKSAEMQAFAKYWEDYNSEKRIKCEELELEMSRQEESKDDNLKKFGEDLSNLAAKALQARSFYSDMNLENECCMEDTQKSNLQRELCEHLQTVEETKRQVQDTKQLLQHMENSGSLSFTERIQTIKLLENALSTSKKQLSNQEIKFNRSNKKKQEALKLVEESSSKAISL